VIGHQRFRGPWCLHFLTLKMYVVWSSETLVSHHITIWHHNPKNSDLNLHCCKNLKSHSTQGFKYRCKLYFNIFPTHYITDIMTMYYYIHRYLFIYRSVDSLYGAACCSCVLSGMGSMGTETVAPCHTQPLGAAACWCDTGILSCTGDKEMHLETYMC